MAAGTNHARGRRPGGREGGREIRRGWLAGRSRRGDGLERERKIGLERPTRIPRCTVVPGQCAEGERGRPAWHRLADPAATATNEAPRGRCRGKGGREGGRTRRGGRASKRVLRSVTWLLEGEGDGSKGQRERSDSLFVWLVADGWC
jgi:hypothetical protein